MPLLDAHCHEIFLLFEIYHIHRSFMKVIHSNLHQTLNGKDCSGSLHFCAPCSWLVATTRKKSHLLKPRDNEYIRILMNDDDTGAPWWFSLAVWHLFPDLAFEVSWSTIVPGIIEDSFNKSFHITSMTWSWLRSNIIKHPHLYVQYSHSEVFLIFRYNQMYSVVVCYTDRSDRSLSIYIVRFVSSLCFCWSFFVLPIESPWSIAMLLR